MAGPAGPDFPWEEDALEHIKDQMPKAEPYRAWQTFTFTATSGHVREVDLFIAAPGGLFLVEIKSHPGTARNNGSTWLFRDDDRTRTIENPLHFTDSKAKDLKTRLSRRPGSWVSKSPSRASSPPSSCPRENLRCEFDEFQRQRVYGRDEPKARPACLASGTASSTSRRAATGTGSPRPSPSSSRSCMQKIGIAAPAQDRPGRPLRARRPKSFDAGPDLGGLPRRQPALPGD